MNTHSDIDGVGHLKVGSVFGIAFQALFWFGLAIFSLIFTALQNSVSVFGTSGTSAIPAWITINVIYFVVASIASASVLGIVSFFFLGFRGIRGATLPLAHRPRG